MKEFDLQAQKSQKWQWDVPWECEEKGQSLATGATHHVIPRPAVLLSARLLMLLDSVQEVFTPEETIWKHNQRPEPQGIIRASQAWKEDLCPELFGSVTTLAPHSHNFDPLM